MDHHSGWRPFSEDMNTVSKQLCMNLLYVSCYLLSTGVFMSVCEVCLTDLRL